MLKLHFFYYKNIELKAFMSPFLIELESKK